MRKYWFCAGLVWLGVTTAAWAGDALEDVQKKIIAALDQHKSLMADMNTLTQIEEQGFKLKGEAKFTLEMLKKGEKNFLRLEGKNNVVQTMADQEFKINRSVLSINDGEFFYTLEEQDGQKQAVKMKADKAQSILAGKEQFEALHKEYALKLLPEEKVDGKDAFVIQATPKESTPMGLGKSLLYFHKDNGIMVKMVMENLDGKPVQTTQFSNIKLNGDISPERFVFKVPAGVELQDMTKMPPPQPEPAQPPQQP